MQYNRILLKLSGESLMGEQKYGIDTIVARTQIIKITDNIIA